jgi:NAD+ diphosphatase
MSQFFWPEPELNFVSAVQAVNDAEDALYFVCAGTEVLQRFDADGNWRPVAGEELESFDHVHRHFMGLWGDRACIAVEVDAGGDEFANLRANLGNIDSTLFNLAGRALQLCTWYQTHRFCGQCGVATVEDDSDRSLVCPDCKLHFYPRLSPSIIVLVHRGDEVLLARNHMFPEGLFSTLAGFVEPGETIEETVRREVREEVGITVGKLEYRGSQPWPFPNSLMLGFHAEYESGEFVLQEDEIAEAHWFPVTDLPLIPGKFAISRWLIDDYLAQRGVPTAQAPPV